MIKHKFQGPSPSPAVPPPTLTAVVALAAPQSLPPTVLSASHTGPLPLLFSCLENLLSPCHPINFRSSFKCQLSHPWPRPLCTLPAPGNSFMALTLILILHLFNFSMISSTGLSGLQKQGVLLSNESLELSPILRRDCYQYLLSDNGHIHIYWQWR